MFQRILIVEDEADTLIWLETILRKLCDGAEVVGAETQAKALNLLRAKPFDLVLLDLYLPDGDGETILERIPHMPHPRPKIILNTIESRPSRIKPTLRLGVDGFVLKDRAEEELPDAVETIASGGAVVSPKAARTMLNLLSAPVDSDEASPQMLAREQLISLTERERDIFIQIALGLSRAAIAQKLDISPHTVATHLRSIYKKLEISSRAEIGVLAAEAGVLDG